MPIYQRGKAYLVSVGSGQGRSRKSFKTLEEAQRYERWAGLVRDGVIEAPVAAPKEKSKPALSQTLGDAYRLTMKDAWAHRKTSSSAKQGAHVLRLVGEDTQVKDITTQVVREMVDELEESGCIGSTINKKLSALSMMLKTASDEGWIGGLPRIKRKPAGDHRIRWLDANEELEALNMCDTLNLMSLKDFIQVAIDTGFRRMELLDFRVKDFHHGMLHLHPEGTKTSKSRSIPATSRVQQIIERRKNNTRLFDDLTVAKLRDQWALIRNRLGKDEDPQFVVHMLRHTCASRLAMQDKTAQFIQQWMGHATPLTTARYMHLAPGKLKEGVAALEDYRKNNQAHLRVA
jgi:integrase